MNDHSNNYPSVPIEVSDASQVVEYCKTYFLVFLDIYKDNCPWCTKLAPVYARAAEWFGDLALSSGLPVVFLKANIARIDKQWALAYGAHKGVPLVLGFGPGGMLPSRVVEIVSYPSMKFFESCVTFVSENAGWGVRPSQLDKVALRPDLVFSSRVPGAAVFTSVVTVEAERAAAAAARRAVERSAAETGGQAAVDAQNQVGAAEAEQQQEEGQEEQQEEEEQQEQEEEQQQYASNDTLGTGPDRSVAALVFDHPSIAQRESAAGIHTGSSAEASPFFSVKGLLNTVERSAKWFNENNTDLGLMHPQWHGLVSQYQLGRHRQGIWISDLFNSRQAFPKPSSFMRQHVYSAPEPEHGGQHRNGRPSGWWDSARLYLLDSVSGVTSNSRRKHDKIVNLL